MKKLASVCAGLLLLLSTSVFAEDHAAQALEHANQAVTHGKAGHTPVLVEHAKAALERFAGRRHSSQGRAKNPFECGF